MSKDIDSEFFELRNKLTKAERKKINNQIARERIEKDGAIRKLGNIAERTASILGGTGNNIPYVSSVDSKRFIELAKKELYNREGKNMGGILEDERVSYGSGELVGGQSMLTDDSQTIQESFIEGNEDFIKRNAKLALEEVPLPKRRDKFIEEDIAIKVNVAKHLGLDEFDKDYYREKIEMKKREMIEGKNPLLSTRQIQNEGGLLGDLDDDREQYVLGGLSRTISKAMSKMMGKGSKEKFSPKNLVEEYEALSPKQYKKRFDKHPSKVKKGKDFDMMMINEVNLSATERAFVKERYPDFTGNTAADVYKHTKSEQVVRDMYANNQRVGIAHGGEPLTNKGLEELHKEEPDVVAKMLREQKQEGGDMDMQMSMLMDKPEPEKELLPDEEMEDNYIDFILD